MAAMANDATMAECSDLMEEMRAVYTCPSDATAVRESQGAFKALSAAYTAQRDGLARSIRGMSQKKKRPKNSSVGVFGERDGSPPR